MVSHIWEKLAEYYPLSQLRQDKHTQTVRLCSSSEEYENTPGLNCSAPTRVIAILMPSIIANNTPPMIADVSAACGPPAMDQPF